MSPSEKILQPGYTLWQLVRYMLRLGALGFGGPIALVGYMHRDLVEQRGWITEADYKEGLALSQLAPGPLAAQLAIYLGYVHYRILGATLAGLAFVMLPALCQAYLPTWTANVLPVIFGLGAISAAKYPDGILAEQSRRLRHLLQRVAPDSLADDHFAEEIEAGVTETEAVGMAPGVAGNTS